MGRLNVNLCGIELDNPVIPASGTFGYGYEFADSVDGGVRTSFIKYVKFSESIQKDII